MHEENKVTSSTSAFSPKTAAIITSTVIVLAVLGGTLYSVSRRSHSVGYKDGTYSVEGDYVTHVGPKSIQVKITLKNNVITDADVTSSEGTDPMSKNYQGQFIAGYKALVIGKDITSVHLSKVSGSSLTPIGFNDALQKIEAQAKI